MSRAGLLKQLQEADEHVATVRARIADAEAALRQDAELDRRRASAAAASASHRTAAEAATAAEAELDALQRRVRDLNRRLYDGSVRNPHDLLEMQRELDALRERKDQAEEVTIALMEAEESASGEEHDAAAAAADRETRRTAELGPLEQRLAALRQELASATGEREQVLAAVAPADVALYTRVAARHHPALVQVSGDSCGGCHLPLSIEERRAVRTGAGIVQCSNCDRILVT